MNARFFAMFALVVALSLIFSSTATAQNPILDTAPKVQAFPASPGASPERPRVFYYERTFGETEVAYLADNSHLFSPYGVGLDASGNLWVAEADGARAMKYSPDGAFLASIGTAGVVDRADDTHFGRPTDAAVEPDGEFWVVDHSAARVVKFTSGGHFQMQLGETWHNDDDNGHFDGPLGVTVDSAGKLYVSDSANDRIQVFDSTGFYTATITGAGTPDPDDTLLENPLQIAVDQDDNLYVADNANHRVQIYDSSHTYSATLGVSGVWGTDNNHFQWPRGVAVDAGNIYVADSGNHRVQIFDRGTLTYVDTLGSFGTGDYQFDNPADVAADSSGNLYVADEGNYRVQKFDGLIYERTFGTSGVPYLTDDFHYNQPVDVAVDSLGNLAIIEGWGRGKRLVKLDASGNHLFTIGEPQVMGSDNEHFADPFGVAFDESGKVYVADCGNGRVQIFSIGGVWGARIGTGTGTGNYEFNCPSGVAFDSAENIYVADASNHRIQIFDSNRIYSATLGVTGVAESDDSHFDWPMDVAVDSQGNIFVADTLNQRVQVFDSTGAFTLPTMLQTIPIRS